MLFATNSLKYGALSCAEGILDVSGSKLLRRGMDDLGGQAEVAWLKTGVVISLQISADRLRT